MKMMLVSIGGLKGQQAYSPGQRPGYGNDSVMVAPQGQKQLTTNNAFALSGRNNRIALITQGVALGWGLLPLRGAGMPQRDSLIELNKNIKYLNNIN